MKNKKIAIMEQAEKIVQFREDFLKLGVICDETEETVKEMVKIIRSRNKENHTTLIIFLTAICSSWPRRFRLLRFKLQSYNPSVYKRLVKLGFKEPKYF